MTRLLVLDTETGGLDPLKHSILSLGAVVWEDGARKNEFEVLIREPSIEATQRALEENHINIVEHQAKATPPDAAMALFQNFLRANFPGHFSSTGEPTEKIPLAGHNIDFDVGFLRRFCRLTNVSFEKLFSHRSMDTGSVLRFLILAGKLPFSEPTSDAAFRYFKIEPPTELRHTSLGDARATAELISKLLSIVK